MFKTRFLRLALLPSLALALFLVLLPSCKKAEEAKTAAPTSPYLKTVIANAPENATALFYFNANGDAMKRYMQSPYFNNQSDQMSKFVETLEKQAQATYILTFINSLKAGGINILDPLSVTASFPELLVYLAPRAQGTQDPISFGLVAKTKDKNIAQTLVKAVSETKDNAGENAPQTKPLSLSKGSGIETTVSYVDKQDGLKKQTTLFVAWDDTTVVATNDKGLVETTLAPTTVHLPSLFNAPQIQTEMAKLPASNELVGFLVADIAGVAQAAVADEQSKAEISKIPFSYLIGYNAMKDGPTQQLKLLYAQNIDTQIKGVITSLQQSSSEEVISAVAGNPMFLLSLDAQSVRSLAQASLAQSQNAANQEAQDALAILNGASRIALIAQVAPVGRSPLPIPDVMVVINSSTAQQTKDSIVKVGGKMISSSGMGSRWQTKKVADTDVNYVMSPLGLGVLVAAKGNLVLLSTSETELKAALENSQNKSFVLTSSLKGEALKALNKEASALSLYLDFAEIASFLENISGIAQMYAPQDKNINKMLEPKQIEQLRKSGKMTASLKLEPDSVTLQNAYN